MPSPRDFERLKEACLELEATISEIGQGDIEDQYHAYYTAIAIFVLLAEWKHAIRNAEPDAQRFLSSAKLKASEVDKSLSFTADERLATFLDQVEDLKSVDELTAIQDQLKRWTLPLLLFVNLLDRGFGGFRVPISNVSSAEPEKLETTVAFLKFDIDGDPAKHLNYLKPGTSYDLTIEVRVSNWPKGANALSLTPVTIDIRERNWLPIFRFEKPEGDGPFIFTGTGRAVLEVAHSFGSRPYEFLYAAEFDDTSSSCQDVAIIGHRRLRLEGSDVTSNPLTGFSNVDRHLLSVRDKLRTFPGLHSDDIANTMTILGGLGNIAAQALKGGLFEAGTSEQQFQNKTTEMLRNRSDIGEHLQSHPEAAGGVTDLIFRDIPIELKVENNKVLFPKDCTKFFDQTAAYAIGLGKRIGVLSILESSPKSAPLGIVEDDIEVFAHQTGQSTVLIVVVVVRGGFPKPSSYSR
ncbi:hypothetical protein ASZ90_006558 [hydrocarbon metagenome]|uniref:Uncharacterized protein n=1 Tax=hydrocarbon metagenome TaxID=938273 RepID=A0A0W8FRW2_9ZZZZ